MSEENTDRRITNAEYMINLLLDTLENEEMPFTRLHLGDSGCDPESMIYYNISCPYYCGDNRAVCKNGNDATRENCTECKYKWLLSEVDE